MNTFDEILDQEIDLAVEKAVKAYDAKLKPLLQELIEVGSIRLELQAGEEVTRIPEQDAGPPVIRFTSYGGRNLLAKLLLRRYREVTRARMRTEARRRLAQSLAAGLSKDLAAGPGKDLF